MDRRIWLASKLSLSLLTAVGCAYPEPSRSAWGLRDRILPPVEIIETADELEMTPLVTPPGDWAVCADEIDFEHPISLEQAIEFALRNNPRLRVAQQAIEQARGGKQVAFAPFLPEVIGSYKYVAAASEIQNFTGSFVPFTIGFGPGAQDFALGEVRLQWTVWDFGRTLGKVEQSSARLDIARLQMLRANQTVTFDVTSMYLRVLFTQAAKKVEEQALVRAESILKESRELLEGGVFEPDHVLRAEIQVAEAKQKLVAARSAEAIAVAGLNLAMGRNVSSNTQVAGVVNELNFERSLAECLQLAVDNRQEFDIARKTIAAAWGSRKSAKGDFLPKIYVRGALARVDGQGVEEGNVQIAGIHFEQNIYEGGRRAGEAKIAEATVRQTIAQAQGVCDAIAYSVLQAFRGIEDARERIALARTSTAQAKENMRLVTDKYKAGDRTPTDVVDAETTLTRSEQSLYAALYEYQTAIAALEYAAGVSLARRQ